jgi:hypothetical protein
MMPAISGCSVRIWLNCCADDAKLCEQCRGVLDHQVPVDSTSLRWLAPDVNVLSQREVGKERGFLVDDRYALLTGGSRTALTECSPGQQDRSGVQVVLTGQCLHQGRLAGAVLPQQSDDFTCRD